jgi:hypothetical protein
MISKVQETKTNIDKWNFIRVKSFCITKGAIIIVKRQLTEWQKTFANYASD